MWKFAMLLLRLQNELRFAWTLLRARRSPLAVKAAVAAAVLYVLSPIGQIPVLGWLGDALVVTLLLKLASHLLPESLRATLRAEAARRATVRH
jgi:uncharacterized membrane protein YkvA (DUF1232 family)